MRFHRKCDLVPCPPFREIFGTAYGVCPLEQECPPEIVCGYANSQGEIARVRGIVDLAKSLAAAGWVETDITK